MTTINNKLYLEALVNKTYHLFFLRFFNVDHY